MLGHNHKQGLLYQQWYLVHSDLGTSWHNAETNNKTSHEGQAILAMNMWAKQKKCFNLIKPSWKILGTSNLVDKS